MATGKNGLKLNVSGGKLQPGTFQAIADRLEVLEEQKKIRAQATTCLERVTTTNYGELGLSFTGRARVDWVFRGETAKKILNDIIASCTADIEAIEKALAPVVDFAPPKPPEGPKTNDTANDKVEGAVA